MSTAKPDVSVVLCTHDRPAQLEQLLDAIVAQETGFAFEIVVVDNQPGSDAVASLAERHAGVRFVAEPRTGLSYARNAGIRAARADRLVLVDDDVVVAPGWLEALAGPLLHGDVDAVTGPMRAWRLETEAERLFEVYGGHGHAGHRRVFDRSWLDRQRWRLPLWEVGSFGNAALRRQVFARLGGFEEALGVGTPAGSSEDLDYLYRMLRGGFRILHEPAAAVRHRHRADLPALARQLAGYRRGEACFCLLAAKRHRDPRALSHLLVWMPAWHASLLVAEIRRRLRGEQRIPFWLMAHQLLAFAGAPRALLASRRRKRKLAPREGALLSDDGPPEGETPRFSVVIPTRGRPRALAQCLRALADLEPAPAAPFEVVVVDDGSPEPLDVAVAPWRARLRIRLVRQEHAGPAAARNRGSDVARGEWLVFLDDDCQPRPGWLAAFAAAGPEPGEALGGPTLNALPGNRWSAASQELVGFVCDWLLRHESPLRFLPSNNFAVSARRFHAVGGFSPDFPLAAAEDREFCRRWLAAGGRLRVVEKARVGHRHPLGPFTFVRQHFRYGRGAFLFHVRARTGARPRVLPLAFYRDMLAEPWRRPGRRALPRSLMLALSQVATVTGFCFQGLADALATTPHRLPRRPRPSPPHRGP